MFTPPIAVASLSGASDATWATNAAPYVGAAFLGGIALDPPTRAAARQMVARRDREEFLPPNPIKFIQREIQQLSTVSIQPGVNVRTTTVGPLRRAARVCYSHDAILEINAHCRQAELCAVGCGEPLLGDTDRLTRFVKTASNEEVTVSVKVRAEIPGISLPELANRLVSAGADILHVDAMDSESVIAAITREIGDDAYVIANNGVRDHQSVQEYFEYGADAVSVGRPSDDPAVLERVRTAVETYLDEREVPV